MNKYKNNTSIAIYFSSCSLISSCNIEIFWAANSNCFSFPCLGLSDNISELYNDFLYNSNYGEYDPSTFTNKEENYEIALTVLSSEGYTVI